MIARVLDIPDDEAEVPAWLDEQIVGPNLHEIVAELAAVHGVATMRSASAEEASAWLGDSLPGVLERGTAALDGRRIGELLRTPSLFPGLQELVFVEGGDHWDAVARRTLPPPAPAADVLRRASPAGDATAPDRRAEGLRLHAEADPRSRPVADASPSSAAVGPRPRRRSVPGLFAAVAASVLVALGAWSLWRPHPAATPWGWNRPDALAAAAPDAYLDRLAAAAGEWSAVSPKTEEALASRLRELLAGCDRLLAASHEPLAAADREWLVERCRAWREKIAGHLAKLDASHDVEAVDREAGATVEKLTAALRARAVEIRGRDAAAPA